MDRGVTRSILKTHFEKEDLEGKTISGEGIALVFQRDVKFVIIWRTAKVDIRIMVVVAEGEKH